MNLSGWQVFILFMSGFRGISRYQMLRCANGSTNFTEDVQAIACRAGRRNGLNYEVRWSSEFEGRSILYQVLQLWKIQLPSGSVVQPNLRIFFLGFRHLIHNTIYQSTTEEL